MCQNEQQDSVWDTSLLPDRQSWSCQRQSIESTEHSVWGSQRCKQTKQQSSISCFMRLNYVAKDMFVELWKKGAFLHVWCVQDRETEIPMWNSNLLSKSNWHQTNRAFIIRFRKTKKYRIVPQLKYVCLLYSASSCLPTSNVYVGSAIKTVMHVCQVTAQFCDSVIT